MIQLVYIVLLLYCPAFAQQEKDSIVIKNRIYYAGETYLDSIKIDMDKTYLNPKNIKLVHLERGKEAEIHATRKGGIIFITRKKDYKLLPLDGITLAVRKSHNIPENEKINPVIDGTLIKNPKGYFIEENYIKKIEILTSSPEIRNSHMGHPPTIIITTKSGKKKK